MAAWPTLVRAPPSPPSEGHVLLAPTIGGLATEAHALADAANLMDEDVNSVVFASPDGMSQVGLGAGPSAASGGGEAERRRRAILPLQADEAAADGTDSPRHRVLASPEPPQDQPPEQAEGSPRRRAPAASSSSSSSSSDDAAEQGPPVDEVDPVPADDRVDGHARAAQVSDQRKVYLWTLSHTTLDGRQPPSAFTRQTFARAVLEAYRATGKSVVQWSCFMEVHPLSRSEKEQHAHFHFLVQADRACRWSEIAQHLRTQQRIYASASTSSSRKSYWAAFAYLFTPSVKKPKEALDQDYILSPEHD